MSTSKRFHCSRRCACCCCIPIKSKHCLHALCSISIVSVHQLRKNFKNGTSQTIDNHYFCVIFWFCSATYSALQARALSVLPFFSWLSFDTCPKCLFAFIAVALWATQLQSTRLTFWKLTLAAKFPTNHFLLVLWRQMFLMHTFWFLQRRIVQNVHDI